MYSMIPINDVYIFTYEFNLDKFRIIFIYLFLYSSKKLLNEIHIILINIKIRFKNITF